MALNNSVTDYVFLSDVDFIPVPGLHAYLQENIEKGLLAKKDVSIHTNLTRNMPVGDFPSLFLLRRRRFGGGGGVMSSA